jgi:uncharacterized protein YndB with AHSA1/START domain
MKWLLLGVAILTALAVVVGGIGWLLPVAHTARRQQRLPVPPESVWKVITDVAAFPSWRADVARVESLPNRDGRTIWTEHGSSGEMTISIERSEPPRLLVTRIEPGLPFGGTWTYELAPDAGGSVLTITERGEVYNPIFRFMSRFIFGHDSTLAGYMAALHTRLSTPAGR